MKNPKVSHLKIPNHLRPVFLLSTLPVEPSHPAGLSGATQAADPVSHLAQSPSWVAPFLLGTPLKIRPTPQGNEGRDSTSEDAQRSLPAPGEDLAQSLLHRLQTSGSGKQQHPGSRTHAPSGTPQPLGPSDRFHPSGCQPPSSAGRGAVRGGAGRGAVRKNPARLRGPVLEGRAVFLGREWAGLVV